MIIELECFSSAFQRPPAATLIAVPLPFKKDPGEAPVLWIKFFNPSFRNMPATMLPVKKHQYFKDLLHFNVFYKLTNKSLFVYPFFLKIVKEVL